MRKQDRLKELKKELEDTYLEMNAILTKNEVGRRDISHLPSEDYDKWLSLNNRSILLISEFSDLLKAGNPETDKV